MSTQTPPSTGLDRRRFLAAAGVGVGAGIGVGYAGLARSAAAEPTAQDVELVGDPFVMGVASGDPDDTSVVLWTRLSPAPTDPSTGFGMRPLDEVAVTLRVASSPERLAREADCLAVQTHTAIATEGFSVHALVQGLRPRTRYYYQFAAGGYQSPVGETRTLPAPDSMTPVRFAVINCQNVAGVGAELYFNAMTDLVAAEDVDFVVFLGDYIYEFGRAAHLPPTEVDDIVGYRTRYGQYKSRESLRELHRRFPVFAVPDDHEFFNDVRGGTLPARPARWNAAVRAFWENLPLRTRPRADPAGRLWLELHRRIRAGRVLDLFLTDVRQFEGPDALLGDEQEAALLDLLDTSTARFTALGVQTPMSVFTGRPGLWGAHPQTRRAITDRMLARKQADPRSFNPVVLSGDVHCGMVLHVQDDPRDVSSTLVATEFLNAPMTSGSAADWEAARQAGEGGEGFLAAYGYDDGAGWRQYNGLTVCTVTPGSWTTTYRLGRDVEDPTAGIELTPSWALRYGGRVGSVRPVD